MRDGADDFRARLIGALGWSHRRLTGDDDIIAEIGRLRAAAVEEEVSATAVPIRMMTALSVARVGGNRTSGVGFTMMTKAGTEEVESLPLGGPPV